MIMRHNTKRDRMIKKENDKERGRKRKRTIKKENDKESE